MHLLKFQTDELKMSPISFYSAHLRCFISIQHTRGTQAGMDRPFPSIEGSRRKIGGDMVQQRKNRRRRLFQPCWVLSSLSMPWWHSTISQENIVIRCNAGRSFPLPCSVQSRTDNVLNARNHSKGIVTVWVDHTKNGTFWLEDISRVVVVSWMSSIMIWWVLYIKNEWIWRRLKDLCKASTGGLK